MFFHWFSLVRKNVLVNKHALDLYKISPLTGFVALLCVLTAFYKYRWICSSRAFQQENIHIQIINITNLQTFQIETHELCYRCPYKYTTWSHGVLLVKHMQTLWVISQLQQSRLGKKKKTKQQINQPFDLFFVFHLFGGGLFFRMANVGGMKKK